MRTFRSPFCIASLLVAAACSSAGETAPSGGFPATALMTLASDSGKLHVEVRTSPYQPAIAGLDSVELVVTDATTSAPIDGLSITMTPWMPAMDHGTSVTPQLTPMGSGHYVFTDVSLFMAGEWELRTKFSGEVDDSAEPTFSVP